MKSSAYVASKVIARPWDASRGLRHTLVIGAAIFGEKLQIGSRENESEAPKVADISARPPPHGLP